MIDQPLAVQEESRYKAQRKEGPGRVGDVSSWSQLFRGALPTQLENSARVSPQREVLLSCKQEIETSWI